MGQEQEQEQEPTHAPLGPSSASRWLYCTKSPEECVGCENKTSSFAEEGTQAHAVLESFLLAGSYQDQVSEEMMEAVNVAYNFVEELKGRHPDLIIMAESKVYATSLSPDVWGTADVTAYSAEAKTVYVIDYKHGQGVAVEVKDNPQPEIYAIGALDSFGFMFEDVETVVTTIIQPRCPHGDGPVREAVYSMAALDKVRDMMKASIATIGTDKAKYAPSDKACRWCPAKGKCGALRRKSMAALGIGPIEEGIPDKDEAKDENEAFLSQFQRNKDLIQIWFKALEAEVVDRLMRGEAVGEYKVVEGRSRRKWGQPDSETATALQQDLKLRPKDFYDQKLKSFTKIEKLIDVKKRNGKKKLARFNELVVKPEGKPTVVGPDDKREALTPVIFEAINN